MEDLSKIGSFALLGDADPVPQSLFQSHPEQANTLALLYEVSREVTSILDREELLRRVAERVKKIVNYDVFSVMLWNEQTQLLESAFAMCATDSIAARLRIPLHRGLTGTAAGERRVLRINDVTEDPRYIRCETGVEARSELVVPLLMQDRLIGVLDLESTAPHAFTLEHERMLSTLGSYVAIALENARLFEEAKENERRMRGELDTAREIQRQLLPTGAREVPGLDLAAGYVPACEPACMLALLNQRLLGARLDSRFIAMLFAVYDASTRKLTLANAGGPYPLLVRKGQVQAICLEGVPLGLIPDTQYDETTIDLQPGDVVVFASDGILESENPAQEEFGPERLKKILSAISQRDSAREITELIMAATDGHGGAGIAPHDDRTLVVLRVIDDSSSDFSKLPIIY